MSRRNSAARRILRGQPGSGVTPEQQIQSIGSQGKANPNRPDAYAGKSSEPIPLHPRTDSNRPNPSSGKPYPAMPEVSERDPLLQSYAASGTAIFSGIITTEEYNPDFHWKDGIKIYEQMLRNDAQINAIRSMVELPIRRAQWSIQPASDDPKDKEIASFVESCLFHDMTYMTSEGRQLTQKWDDILRHILMSLWFGFIPFEVCWKIENGWVKWEKWTPMLPRTIWRWWVGEDNELVGVQQWTFKDYTYQFIDIPAEKLLLFVHRQEGNNYEGLSLLRSAYKHWFYKVQFEKIEAIGIERNAIVPPVVKLPENFTGNDVIMAQNIAQNVRANELMGVVIPPGWDFEYPRNNQNRAEAVQPSIQYHDVMIARNVLAQFINLGSNETGSYALADTQLQTFLNSLQGICSYIEDVINSDAIPRLVNYNYDNVDTYPTLKVSKLQGDLNVISQALKDFSSGTSPLLQPYDDLSNWIADQLGIPAPPRGVIRSVDPTAPNTPQQPDATHTVQNQGSQNTEGKATSNSNDDGGSMTEREARAILLREVNLASDAVERGILHEAQQKKNNIFQLMNPNRAPNGQFTYGPGVRARDEKMTRAHEIRRQVAAARINAANPAHSNDPIERAQEHIQNIIRGKSTPEHMAYSHQLTAYEEKHGQVYDSQHAQKYDRAIIKAWTKQGGEALRYADDAQRFGIAHMEKPASETRITQLERSARRAELAYHTAKTNMESAKAQAEHSKLYTDHVKAVRAEYKYTQSVGRLANAQQRYEAKSGKAYNSEQASRHDEAIHASAARSRAGAYRSVVEENASLRQQVRDLQSKIDGMQSTNPGGAQVARERLNAMILALNEHGIALEG